jgi:hypothetical protein
MPCFRAPAPGAPPRGDAPDGDATSAAAPGGGGDWVARYVAFLQRWRITILLFWVAIFGFGMLGVGRVFDNLKLQARGACVHGSCAAQRWFRACFLR